MRHPAENWIKYLLSKGSHSREEISGIMEMFSLGGISRSYIDGLEDEILQDRPNPFHPKDRIHTPSQSYLRRHGIYKAWHRDETMEEALAILSNQSVRSLVEVFILSPVTPAQAVAKINEREGSNLSVPAYERFRYYFWNSQLLSGAEWGDFVQRREVSHREWLKLAVNAHDPQGVQLLLWKTGVGALKNLDRAKIFTDFRNIAYMKAKELEHSPACVDDSKALLNYARVARSSQEEVSSSSDAVRDVLESFNAFRMKRQSSESPSILQLTGGDFASAETIAVEDDSIDY